MGAKNVLSRILGNLKEDSLMEYLEDNPEELDNMVDIIRDFAKLHVQAALKAVEKDTDAGHVDWVYPLDNIK